MAKICAVCLKKIGFWQIDLGDVIVHSKCESRYLSNPEKYTGVYINEKEARVNQSEDIDIENDEDIYLKAEEEFNSNKRKEALWIKSMTLSQGDEKKAKYKYIEVRVKDEKEKQTFKRNMARYQKDIINVQWVETYLSSKKSYANNLKRAGINSEKIFQFLYENPIEREIYNRAGGGEKGLNAIPELESLINREISSNSESINKIKKSKNKSFPDHWAEIIRKTFLVVYPFMFLSGFIFVLFQDVKNPFRFVFYSIFDGGISTAAFVAFIISVIWTLAIKKGKESSK